MDGLIPWLAVQDYGREFELDRRGRAILWSVIHAMDRAEREFKASNKTPPPKAEKPGAPSGKLSH